MGCDKRDTCEVLHLECLVQFILEPQDESICKKSLIEEK
jgi:hypothetical protein